MPSLKGKVAPAKPVTDEFLPPPGGGPQAVTGGLAARTTMAQRFALLPPVVGLFVLWLQVYVFWLLIRLTGALERMLSHTMPVKSMQSTWVLLLVPAVGQTLHAFGVLLAFDEPLLWTFQLVITVVNLVVMASMLILFWNAAQAYEEAMAHPVELLPPED